MPFSVLQRKSNPKVVSVALPSYLELVKDFMVRHPLPVSEETEEETTA